MENETVEETQPLGEISTLRQRVAELEMVQEAHNRAEKLSQALQESEARLRDLFESTHDLVQSVLPDGRFLFVNRAWREVLG